MNNSHLTPVGVKIISVLYFIGAVFGILFGLLFIVGAGALGSIAEQIPLLGALGAGLFVAGGVILIVSGVLGFFIGRGLWKAREWARIAAIILAALWSLMSLILIFGGDIGSIVSLAIQLVIGGYLLFNKNVKKAFA